MKSIKCDSCDFKAEGETFDEWFKNIYAHNVSAHPELMKEMMSQPKEEGEKWMAGARAKFDAAPTL